MVCGKLEIDILNAFWSLSEDNEERDISILDVVNELSSIGIDRAYTTIKTVMDRLTVKSILVRYKSGKKFFYKAAMSRDEMAREAVQELVTGFFSGNHINMIKFVEREYESLMI